MTMALTLELEPPLEQRLHEMAARRGLTAEQYARSVLEGLLTAQAEPDRNDLPFYDSATPEEWDREFDAFLATFEDVTAPEIPLETLRREYLYEDRGL
jgi:hypothetical protein